MDHADHVRLIRPGLGPATGAGLDGRPATPPTPPMPPGDPGRPRWLEIGAGEGAFTLALAELLGPGALIVALDRDRAVLGRLAEAFRRSLPDRYLETVVGDFRNPLPAGPFDGVLAANSLHFVPDPVPILRRARAALRASGRLIVVEYDADSGNPWVPHPFSSARFPDLALAAGFREPRVIGRVPSRFLNAIYAAAATVADESSDR